MKGKKKGKKNCNTHQIKIEGINENGTLKLSPESKVIAKPGDYVIWSINTDEVSSISAINDTSGADVFKPDPRRMMDEPKKWSGRINPKLCPLPQDEIYSIYYTKKGGAELYTDDPKIQVES